MRNSRIAPAAGLCVLMLLSLSCDGNDGMLTPFPPEGAVLAGTVRVEGAGPAPGVAVNLEPVIEGLPASVRAAIESDGIAGSAATGLRVTTTDAHGHFAFDGVEAGRYLVTSAARDHRAGSRRIEVPERLVPSAVETTFVDIALMPTGTFTGSATLEAAAVHRSTVVYVDGESNVAVTDAAGRYILRDVPVGAQTVFASHGGWLDASVEGTLVAAGDSVELGPMVLPRDSNIPPAVIASASMTGNVLAPFSLSATATDVDGTVVLYEWDFDGDGTYDFADPNTGNTTHLYDTDGAYTAKIRVTDDRGAIGLAAVSFHIHDAFYVATDGVDTNPGTRALPFRTIQHGLDAAAANEDLPVRVAVGTYAETPNLPDGCDLQGGYERATWLPSGSHSVISTGTTPMIVIGIGACRVSWCSVEASNAVTGSSLALVVDDCPSPDVEFLDCRFVSGDAVSGAAGGNGTNGAAGRAGPAGEDFYGGTAAWGGDGGYGGLCSTLLCGPVSGSNGQAGPPPLGGTGGLGRTSDGGDGGPGAVYPQAGSQGTAAAIGGTWTGYAWLANAGGNAGTGGQGGSGGGGGGGGGGFNISGGGGGCGGEGGLGGVGGGGGLGGGGSFAILVTGSSNPAFTRCTIDAGNAGNGGYGGNGGLGGVGGTGGIGGIGDAFTRGGAGGIGGNGSPGGGGAGGGGGWAVGLYIRFGSSCDTTACTFDKGARGYGGRGGLRGGSTTARAPDGPDGQARDVFTES